MRRFRKRERRVEECWFLFKFFCLISQAFADKLGNQADKPKIKLRTTTECVHERRVLCPSLEVAMKHFVRSTVLYELRKNVIKEVVWFDLQAVVRGFKTNLECV